jgi:hypothetical protein
MKKKVISKYSAKIIVAYDNIGADFININVSQLTNIKKQ